MSGAKFVAASLALTLSGCTDSPATSAEEARVEPAEELMQAAVDEVFPGADPATVVATTEAGDIVVADVAAYLLLFPQLSVDQAVSDLIDMRILAGAAESGDVEVDPTRATVATRLALVRGRALAWTRIVGAQHPSVVEPDPEQVELLASSQDYLSRYGTPELATVSHLLVRVSDESDAAWDTARELASVITPIWESAEFRDRMTLERLRDEAELWLDDAGNPEAIEALLELRFAFPEEYSGEPTWDGVPAVVPEFATAVFETDAGHSLGPLETEFGIHYIIVENRTQADVPSDERRREQAEADVRSTAAANVLVEEANELRSQLEVRFVEQNLALLSQDGMERLSEESREQASEMTGR